MTTTPDAPEVVRDLALGAFRLVKERLGLELDFTPETLPFVDHYLAELRVEDDGHPDDKAVGLVAPCVGAYFGEVCRRSLTGLVWRETGEDYEAWRLGREDGAIGFNPVGVVLEALYLEPVASFAGHFEVAKAHREAVESALALGGPVREEDYYRLAVRHEALEQALSVILRAAN